MMPFKDRFPDELEKKPEEKAIIGTLSKYFNTAPSQKISKNADIESSIIDTLRRYFGAK
jgi:hypothetical protein